MSGQTGEVIGSIMLSDRSEVVVFVNDPEDAAEAARGFDGVELCGRVMEVTVDVQ